MASVSFGGSALCVQSMEIGHMDQETLDHMMDNVGLERLMDDLETQKIGSAGSRDHFFQNPSAMEMESVRIDMHLDHIHLLEDDSNKQALVEARESRRNGSLRRKASL
eukprot:CAMPEP_0183297224 /NCGR_PEP_ID=MMETSP0160_2-20130417/4570_1 /TAXON_ID=2839 ORGANISM="Odontella Sinensis, Strain Grunow 1884" /NCGR_SAMPLE_ID=MMETSP0160_2 /ASSEMBLY_ACC=CAM_ASM_000250 /LENGTH=107 /DNA_ID=CAMNT_0025458999 /DNA_START=181 /DNA_END=504 /DNA_ORIENTATION=+